MSGLEYFGFVYPIQSEFVWYRIIDTVTFNLINAILNIYCVLAVL